MQRLEATDSLVLAAQLLAALDCPAAEALRQVEAPVVALVPTSPRLDPAVLRSLQPEASVEQVRDGGHFFFVTRPAETNALLKRILVDESPTTDESPIG